MAAACACGNRGCLEQYASGSALVAEARELARRAQGRGSRMLQLGGGRPEGIGGPQVTQAAREGDPDALRCFQIVGGWLGQAMADLAAILDPGCFVIGGGVSDAGDLLLTPARAVFGQALTGRGYRACADVRIAELGADAGLVAPPTWPDPLIRRTPIRQALIRPHADDVALIGRADQTTAPSSGPESRS